MNLDKAIEISIDIDKVNVSVNYNDISLIQRMINSYNQILKPAVNNTFKDEDEIDDIKNEF